MKKFLLASVALVAMGMSVPAMAADMPVKARVAPEIVPTWAGWYVGLNAGGVSAGASPSSTILNNNIFPGANISQIEAGGSTSIKRSSVLEGAQVGYLGQWGNFVAGVEAGIDRMGISATRSDRIPYATQAGAVLLTVFSRPIEASTPIGCSHCSAA